MPAIRISVCMAAYNGERYITEMLESVLSQLSDRDEVILSDDHSTDHTLERVEAFDDARIKILRSPVNQGYTANFEKALSHARGKYIFLADQDDVWMPGKVERCLRELGRYDFVVTDAQVCDENLRCTAPSHVRLTGSRSGFIHNWLRTRYIGACMAFRRKVLTRALPFPKNREYCAHDYWIACVAEFYFRTKLIQKPYLKYRRHEGNASGGGVNRSEWSIFRKICKRIYTIKELVKRR